MKVIIYIDRDIRNGLPLKLDDGDKLEGYKYSYPDITVEADVTYYSRCGEFEVNNAKVIEDCPLDDGTFLFRKGSPIELSDDEWNEAVEMYKFNEEINKFFQ